MPKKQSETETLDAWFIQGLKDHGDDFVESGEFVFFTNYTTA